MDTVHIDLEKKNLADSSGGTSTSTFKIQM